MKHLYAVVMSIGLLSGAAIASNMGPYYWDDSQTVISGDLTVTGTATIGDTVCNNISTTTLTVNTLNVTGNTALTGTLAVTGATSVSTATVSGSQGLILATPIDVTVSSPTAKGTLAITSAGVLYISSGTGTVTSWLKVGAQ